jgi:hypothetical protein
VSNHGLFGPRGTVHSLENPLARRQLSWKHLNENHGPLVVTLYRLDAGTAWEDLKRAHTMDISDAGIPETFGRVRTAQYQRCHLPNDVVSPPMA